MIKLASPTTDKKGLIVFKHLEQPFIQDLILSGYWKSLRKYYYLGLYFGGYTDCKIDSSKLDLFIARKGVIRNEENIERHKIVRFSGSTFIPDEIINYRKPYDSRTIDVLGIFNRSPHKRPEDFIEMSKALHVLEPNLRIKLITYGNSKNNVGFLQKIYKHPNFNFQDFVLNNGSWPLSKDSLYQELANAKNFVLTSRLEGSSRTVFEAALLETRTFVRPDLKGGTVCRTLIQSNLLRVLQDLSKPVEVLSEFEEHSTEDLEAKFLESTSIEAFIRQVTLVLKDVNKIIVPQGEPFSKILPSHGKTIPSFYTNPDNDQLRSAVRFVNFIRNEEKCHISGKQWLLLILDNFRETIRILNTFRRWISRG